jgi:hypothetical protein
VNAFELYLPPLTITREVSTDTEDDDFPPQGSQAMTQILPPPPLLMRAAPSWVHSRVQVLEDTDSRVVPAPCNRRMSRTPYRGSDLFSPATDDMQTKNSIEGDDEGYMEEYDDLRRKVGSNDYCDDEECRDGREERDGPDEREGNYGDVNNFSRALASCCSMEETDEYSKHKRE